MIAAWAICATTAAAASDDPQPAPFHAIATYDGFDQQLDSQLTMLIDAAQIGPQGEVFLNHLIADRQFLEPGSGHYWQISGNSMGDFVSRSLWNRRLEVGESDSTNAPRYYNSDQFEDEPLRIIERVVVLPGSDVEWHFIVARRSDR